MCTDTVCSVHSVTTLHVKHHTLCCFSGNSHDQVVIWRLSVVGLRKCCWLWLNQMEAYLSVGLFRSDTMTRQLPHLLISVRKLIKKCSTISSIMTSLCSAHSSHQKGVNNILAVTTCSFQFVSLLSMTITFYSGCFLKIYHTNYSRCSLTAQVSSTLYS